eukprot:10640973-Alexandrium_andersonii.AAC.1
MEPSQDAAAEAAHCKASTVFHFRFRAQPSGSDEQERAADPVSESLAALRSSQTRAHVETAMHAPDLFK